MWRPLSGGKDKPSKFPVKSRYLTHSFSRVLGTYLDENGPILSGHGVLERVRRG